MDLPEGRGTRPRRHESEAGSWEMAERAPHPALAGAVHRYVGYAERSSTTVRMREVPQARVTVILNLGPRMTVGGPGRPAERHGSFIAPIDDRHATTELTDARGIQVDLSPLAAHALLGVPMRELDRLVVELDDLAGPEAARLLERLHEAPGWEARFDLLDRAIGRRLEGAPRPSPDVARAWHRLRETGGRLPIGELAAELGCSRGHLVARFREQVGPPPKVVARIVRFRRVVGLLERGGGAGLAEIARDCGYYDQAHLNRDFRELAGTTPTAYAASRLPGGVGIGA